jgi:hypothetical protein
VQMSCMPQRDLLPHVYVYMYVCCYLSCQLLRLRVMCHTTGESIS